jgi:hypothetical protein
VALTFAESVRLFGLNRFNELSADAGGRRFLLIRSLSRKEQLRRLFQLAGIAVPDVGAKQLFQAAFEADISPSLVEQCIRDVYCEEREVRRSIETVLLNELYLVQEFNWGGLHQNSLEKTIVDNYVKRITKYQALCDSIENQLLTSLRGYVICSWYNHWTSIIIEDIFKDHQSVLPAIGLIKKIDFFVKGVPFDLKVTYLPEGYLLARRQDADKRPELTLLKRIARVHGIPINTDLPASALLQDLWTKVSDHPHADCTDLIVQLAAFRRELVDSIEDDPTGVIRWLYENQGERRFDSANRLFVILVDERNYFESWKLKRAKPRLEEAINGYLNSTGDSPGRGIEFDWENQTYVAISDAIIVRHTNEP